VLDESAVSPQTLAGIDRGAGDARDDVTGTQGVAFPSGVECLIGAQLDWALAKAIWIPVATLLVAGVVARVRGGWRDAGMGEHHPGGNRAHNQEPPLDDRQPAQRSGMRSPQQQHHGDQPDVWSAHYLKVRQTLPVTGRVARPCASCRGVQANPEAIDPGDRYEGRNTDQQQ
jgi:hypothetical protein